MGSPTTGPKNRTSDQEIRERTVLLLVSGLTAEATIQTLINKLSVQPKKAAKLVAEAEHQIVLAANVDRHRELGLAINRLDDIYRRALAVNDQKVALQATRERNKIVGLYEIIMQDGEPMDNVFDIEEINIARQHLENLGYGDESTPLSELTRLAAAEILHLRSRAAN